MIFVDTNALVALVDRGDEFNSRALKWWEENKTAQLLTTNLVVLETLGWVRYNRGKKLAVEIGKRLIDSLEINVSRVGVSDERKAWELFQKVDGRGVSMIDCTSVVVMKKLRIKQVFTFDRDFADLGFEVLPK